MFLRLCPHMGKKPGSGRVGFPASLNQIMALWSSVKNISPSHWTDSFLSFYFRILIYKVQEFQGKRKIAVVCRTESQARAVPDDAPSVNSLWCFVSFLHSITSL